MAGAASDPNEAREFFRLQKQRLDESGLHPSVESTPEPDSEVFSLEEARRLLRDTDSDIKQPVIGYRILEKLGEGGSGAVFRAQQEGRRNEVALKLLFPQLHDDPRNLREFIREGMTLIRIDHPHILRGLDFGFSKGFYFMILELVEGHSLEHYIESRQRFTETEAARIGIQILEALEHLAGRGILHRDIKPSNILLVGRNQVKLSDFGLCLDTKKVDATSSGDSSPSTVPPNERAWRSTSNFASISRDSRGGSPVRCERFSNG